MDYLKAWQNGIPMARPERENAEAAVHVESSDRQLVEMVLAGDENAFEHIFDRYKRHVAASASRYFQKPEQIEEIIQISFAKAYFELARFRGAHDFSLASWLGRIAANTCLDALRNQKRKPANLICELTDTERDSLTADLPNDDRSAETVLIQRDLAEKLLSHLGAKDRAILQMLYAEEMSIAQVADVTGWSNARIKVRAYRARHALRKVLKRFL
jgi:RNA polymerase sigma-70 factor (ECF subfamily)